MHIDILLQQLSKPAQRALQNAGVTSIEQLSKYSEKEVLDLHGIGKNAMIIIKQILFDNGLTFSNKQ
ncbi:MAG: helix-hairpin-helix domain-containing protein [Mobilitalea sp.]